MVGEQPLGSVARRLAATRRVLVVEDEPDIADFLFAYFRASGYDLVHVDPDTALGVLQALDDHRPDCILLDLNLRGFNGSEAYRLVRSDPRYARIPVLMVSARPDAQQLVPETTPLDAFVTKPFNVNVLAELVAEKIEAAAHVAASGPDPMAGLLDHDGIDAALTDQLAQPGAGPVAFALVQLRSLAEVTTLVGDEGTTYVVNELVRRVRGLLPEQVALGVTRSRELAILLPGCDSTKAAELLRGCVDELGPVVLPGGAEAPVRIAIGLAAHPEHAGDADGLYMAADAALADACDADQLLAVAI